MKFTERVTKAIMFFEWLLAGIIIVAVIGEGTMLVFKLVDYIVARELTEKFQVFLSNALLYIIGLEVALMLIKHDSMLIIDIMIYAVARKMIIQNVAIWEILIGVIAILILYYLKCYGVSCRFFPPLRKDREQKDGEQ
ncbi:hypothetical protein [Effusibacillus consociatus]|uniref:Uncharacterized protein n=1 Tax=Effusibacillus consociatus TaxID=1117041 RepID=A0ABV9Q2G4_9BACL